MSTLRDTVRQIADALTGLYDRSEAEAVARAVVTDREGISLSHLVAHSDEPCTIPDLDRMVAELAAGRPVQYVLGHCEFCGIDLEVGEGVLIPRPETEELVEAVIRRIDGGARILDLCTGSGCIAIALAKKIGSSRVTAVDISAQALEYARRNAYRAGVVVEFIESDILRGTDLPSGEFDAVVSNPPYVPASDKAAIHRNVVEYEPHNALFVADDDPLLFYEAIAGRSRRLLRDNGLLCFEIYELYADRVCGLLRDKGYNDIFVIDDANMKPRIVCCRK